MLEHITTVAPYKLTDLLSSAGATIGIIIAGTIFLQFISTKYTELSGRYRQITGEYRGVHCEHNRHAPLRSQIWIYRRRLTLLNWASWLAALALICFLLSVIAGGLSLLYPPVVPIRTVGTAGLLVGLILIGVAVFLELAESILSRQGTGGGDRRPRRGSSPAHSLMRLPGRETVRQRPATRVQRTHDGELRPARLGRDDHPRSPRRGAPDDRPAAPASRAAPDRGR